MDFREPERSTETALLLRRGAGHLLSDPPTEGEIARMLAGVEQRAPRRFSLPGLAAAALLLAAIPLPLLLRDKPEAQEAPPTASQCEPEGEANVRLERYTEAGRAAKRQLRFADALKEFEAAVGGSATEEQIRKYALPARMEIGECLYRLKKYREAHEAYDRAIEEARERDPELAANAAYYRYRSAVAELGGKRDVASRKLRDRERETFMQEFPDHPRAVDLFYYRGADLIAEGNAALADGRKEEARKLWESAIRDYFPRVKRESVLYEKARAREGEALFLLERDDEAIALLRKVRSGWPHWETTDRERQVNQGTARTLATWFLARIHLRREEWAEVLSTLDGFEKAFPDREQRDFHAAVKLQRIRAHRARGDLKAAEAELEVLRKEHPEALHVKEGEKVIRDARVKDAD